MRSAGQCPDVKARVVRVGGGVVLRKLGRLVGYVGRMLGRRQGSRPAGLAGLGPGWIGVRVSGLG
jgi:hypothetical protein